MGNSPVCLWELVLAIVSNNALVYTIKNKILKIIAPDGKVLVDIIPNLSLIIGPQPNVTHMDGVEAQNRLKYVFRLFTVAMSLPECPLVFVLDDLQVNIPNSCILSVVFNVLIPPPHSNTTFHF